MGLIDCDSHVLENEDTWSYLDPTEREYRPKVIQFEEAEGDGFAPPKCWIAGDTWIRRFPQDGNFRGNGNVFESSALDLTNTKARIEDLDSLGIDVQIMISSFFIGVEIDHPLAEAALTRSYNRWVADLASDSKSRLRWTLRPPLRLLDRAFEEMAFGKEHGAVGIHLRGVEHGMFLSDPYFFPLYERAQELDLAIVVHIGSSIRKTEVPPLVAWCPPAFLNQLNPLLTAFYAVISSDFDDRFPRLRGSCRRRIYLGAGPFADALPRGGKCHGVSEVAPTHA